MSEVRLSAEQLRQVCEDIVLIEQAGRMREVWSLRRQLLRDRRPAPPWGQVAADSLAREAANLCGGSPSEWQQAAADALGFPSQDTAGIDALCEVAEEIRWREPQPSAAQARLTIGNRKRGGR